MIVEIPDEFEVKKMAAVTAIIILIPEEVGEEEAKNNLLRKIEAHVREKDRSYSIAKTGNEKELGELADLAVKRTKRNESSTIIVGTIDLEP